MFRTHARTPGSVKWRVLALASTCAAASLTLTPATASAAASTSTPAAPAPASAADARSECATVVDRLLLAAGQPTAQAGSTGAALDRCLQLAAAGHDVSALTPDASVALGIVPALPAGCVTEGADVALAATLNAALEAVSSTGERCAAVRDGLRRKAAAVAKAEGTVPARTAPRASRSGGLRTTSALTTTTTTTGTASISGTVTADAGGAIAGICVFAMDTNGTGAFYDPAVTDATGRYTVSALPAGSYRVHFYDCRQDSLYISEFYDNAQYEMATIVSLTDGQARTGINAALAPGGIITGKVVSDADGSPLSNICIEPHGPNGGTGSGTRPDGTYRVGGIAPGEVRVRFTSCHGDGTAVTEYYDNVATYEQANVLTVVAGRTIPNIDASLSTGQSISGRVTEDGTGTALTGICVSAHRVTTGTMWHPPAGSRSVTGGDYTISGLGAGNYHVSFSDCNESDGDHVSEYFDNAMDPSLATEVIVGTDQPTAGINAALARGGRLTGRVTNSSGQAIDQVCVRAEPDVEATSSWHQYGYDVTAADGTYAVRPLQAGTYVLVFEDCASPERYVSSYLGDTRDRSLARRVTVTAGQATTGLNIALSLGGKITGVVRDESTGQPVEGICLYTNHMNQQAGFLYEYSSARTGTDGAFILGGLAGGDYSVEAFDCKLWTEERYAHQIYDRKTWSEAPTVITLARGATAGPITVNMQPYVVGNGEIGGLVTDGAGTPLQNAYVHTCATGGRCTSASTGADGRYVLRGLVDQEYVVTAFPPSGSSLSSESTPVTVVNEGAASAPTLVLMAPTPPPSGTTVGSTPSGQVPVVIVDQPTPVTVGQKLCSSGGTVTFTVTSAAGEVYRGTLAETPAGSGKYSGDIVVPFTGMSDVVISQTGCPGTITFNLYIDPSGYVRDTTGAGVSGATVTLYRADAAAGPFTVVPNGSVVMDPSNRVNPDRTDTTGHFGWNVAPGYYRVRAEKAGCRDAADSSRTFVESQVYEIPPAVTDVLLMLNCDARSSGYLPVEPTRVMEGSPLGQGASSILTLTNVPVGATSVALNLAAAGVTGNTYVTACPGDLAVDTCKQKASLNTDQGRDRSNLVVVKLGGEPTSSTRTLLFYNNIGNVLLYADLQGYYIKRDATTASPLSYYVPQAPERQLSAAKVGAAQAMTMSLKNVPVGATAVTFNLAAAGVTGNTYVTACPGGTTVTVCKQKASLNAPPGLDTANLVTVKLGGDPATTTRTVLLYNNVGDVLLFADVQGYYIPSGSAYVGSDPTRVMAGRSLAQGAATTLTLQNVPLGAKAVAFNLAAAGVNDNTYVSACPGDVATEVCNQNANLLTRNGIDASVFVVVKLGGDPTTAVRTVKFYNNRGSVLLYADVQGYFS